MDSWITNVMKRLARNDMFIFVLALLLSEVDGLNGFLQDFIGHA